MRALPLSLLFAVATAAPALAQDATPGPPPPVIRPDDGAMTCAQMAEEAGGISKALGEADSDGPMFGRFGGVLRQGAAMLIPGAGIAIAGADALNQPEQERKLALALNQMNRWYYLNGLYIGRGCNAPAPQVVPAPPPVQPPAGG